MFEVLRDCGALARVLPEVDRLWGVPQRADYHPEVDTGVHLMMVLDMAARLRRRWRCASPASATTSARARRRPRSCRATSATRSAASSWCAAMSERLRVANACRELAEVVAREHGNIHRSGEFGAAAIVRLLERCDALRRPERFAEAAARLRVRCARPARPRGRRPIRSARACARRSRRVIAVDATAVAADAAARGLAGPAIGAAIHDARVSAAELASARRRLGRRGRGRSRT